ncbi:MAG TPA: cardiolipin synthase [Steroidobacteraceae bacterium]|nr:cardiolipin synthase [Steroidobacteraceae bacterium]
MHQEHATAGAASADPAAAGKPRRGRIRRVLLWTYLVFQFLGLVSAVDAIMSTRTAQGAIAWSLALVAAPVVSVPAYWVFGRSKFEGYLDARKEVQEEFDHLYASVYDNMSAAAVKFDRPMPVWEALRGLSRTRPVTGNRAELLIDGEATFDSILSGIRAAEDYVLVQFYIVHDDGLGRQLKEAMIERARAGVDVYFLYDEIGTDITTQYKQDLDAAGVRYSQFNTTQGARNRFQLNFRNHRKIVVVDGRTAWIGGHNVGDEYLGLDPDFSPWRDTHVRLDGPIAIQAQGVFASDWLWAQRELLDLNWVPQPAPDSDLPAIVVATGPADPLETAGMFFVHALNSAKERIWITAPYFVPDDAIIKAMMLATLRGVDVRVIVPGKADSLLPQMAAFYYMELLEESAVKFYAFEPGFMHQKVMVIDDQTVSIGTHNFDNRSFRLNFEVAAVVYDAGFASEVAAMFERDLASSRLIRPEDYRERPWYWRFGVRLSRLMAPIL